MFTEKNDIHLHKIVAMLSNDLPVRGHKSNTLCTCLGGDAERDDISHLTD